MKLSPLELKRYFLTEIHFTVSPKFDAQKELELTEADFTVEPEVIRLKPEGREWQVSLKITQAQKPDKNVPYGLSVQTIAFFDVAHDFPEEKMLRMVETNAPSILYGILREVVRDITTRGPYAGLMLPPISFYTSAPAQEKKPGAK